MDIGIFSRTFDGSMCEVFEAIHDCGLKRTHLNLLTCGMEAMPAAADEVTIRNIRRTALKAGIVFDGLSGTFNMIAPDLEEREDGIARFSVLCRIASMLGITMISLCTGSRNPHSKWEWDDRNLLPDAWDDLLNTTEQILTLAESVGIILGIETEASNVVNTAQRARSYLDHFRSPNLKIIMDGANLYKSGQEPEMHRILDEAFALLGRDIVQAHAKDLLMNPGLKFTAAGEGILDFTHYVRLLRKYGFDGTVMLHGLGACQVPASVAFLRGVIAGD